MISMNSEKQAMLKAFDYSKKTICAWYQGSSAGYEPTVALPVISCYMALFCQQVIGFAFK